MKKIALIVAVAGMLAAGAGAAPSGYNDPAGDNGAAPDITSVAVSDSGGAVTVVLTASALTDGQTIDVFLNTDKNDATGSPGGSEFNLEVWQDAGDWGWDMASWANDAWKETPESAAEHFSRSGNIFTWTFPTSEIGGATGFTFSAVAFVLAGSGDVTALDRAPDGGSWVYHLAVAQPAVVPSIGKPLSAPAAPRAGTLLSLSFPVTRADTGAPLSGGSAVASTTVAGKSIPRTIAFTSGTAQLAIAVPKNAKGKTLVVRLTVTLAGKSATRTVSYRIK